MSIRNCSVKPTYESKKDDILSSFYIPLLTNATYYKRVSAYFSSDILRFYSRGIEAIGLRNGSIKFIFSQELKPKEFSLMQKGINNKIVVESLKKQIESLQDSSEISNLAYLISIGLVEIKIAFSEEGILHDKFGFIGDGINEVYFRGSSNETINAVKSNAESFETSLNWLNEAGENLKISNANSKFDEMWNDIYPGLKVVKLPDIIKSEIIKFNKNKLVIDYHKIYTNHLFLDINNLNRVILINNLDNKNTVDTKSPLFKSKIQPYVEKLLVDSFLLYDYGYLKLKEIIVEIQSYSEKKSISFVVSQRLIEWIKRQDLYITQRVSLGIEIKERGPLVKDDFSDFCDKVDLETERPLNINQLWNAYHAVRMRKGANFSVPGTGKTAICYGAFAYLSSESINLIDKVIVVGPISSFLSWKDEFKLVFGKKRKLRVFDTKSKEFNKSAFEKNKILQYTHKNYNLILLNYDSLKGLKETISNIIDERTILIFDEVHKVKNPDGKKALHALQIAKKASYTIILSGTPIPNTYVDIMNLLKIMFPSEYDSYFGFTKSYLKLITTSDHLQEEVNQKIYPFFCRITKKDLKIPPPNDDFVFYQNMEKNEIELFKLVHKKFEKNIFSLFLRLSQASNNPRLLLKKFDKNDDIYSIDDDNDYENDDFYSAWERQNLSQTPKFTEQEKRFILSFDMTSKFEKSLNIVKELANDGKIVLVWGIFIGTLNEIHKRLEKAGIKSILITGETSIFDREKLLVDFKLGKYQVLITNPHTLGESVSLHKICHDAVYFEFSFNLVHMLQSRDRIHRYGLTDSDYTQYHYVFLKSPDAEFDSIDLRTYEKLKVKEDRMINAVENQILFVKNETYEDDILSILNK